MRTQYKKKLNKRVQTKYTPLGEKNALGIPPARAEQRFKNALDIDYILKKYSEIGYQVGSEEPNVSYDNFIDMDYHEYKNYMADIEEDFLKLPLDVRQQYGNDVAQYHNQKLLERRDVLNETIENEKNPRVVIRDSNDIPEEKTEDFGE